jgi:pilus assembly protein CpaE
MLAALRRALGEHATAEPMTGAMTRQSGSSSIVAVLGSRGGVGTTTLAVNLGATLAADPNNAAALLDLDLTLGDADIALEVNGYDNISIADLAQNIERLDMNFLRRAMAKHEPSGLSILRHPLEIAQVGVIHEQHVERILTLLKISYTHLVLDLSKCLLPTDLMALRMADTILLAAQLELASLRNVVRLIHALGGDENLADKVRVVVNRQGADTVEEGISLKKAEEVIGKPIFWQIPNDPKAVIGARVAGQPLIKHAPKSRVQQAIHGLAQALFGKAAADRGSKGWFGRR